MWQLENRTRYTADRTWVRDRDGAERWIVAVKCTFDVMPDGSIRVSDEQSPVTQIPEYTDPRAPAKSSLRHECDLVRVKTATDVVVLGHAYAPRREAVQQVDVAVRVGTVVKQLRVTGDRVWQGDGPSAAVPFTRMPLVYERAYGGVDAAHRATTTPAWDMRNPVGIGFATIAPKAGQLRLPNIEYPDQLMQRWDDRPPPAGLGPVCCHWQPRVDYAGTYDEAWQNTRLPLLPLDFDDRYFQCVPTDQQAAGFLIGGERVILKNLTADGMLCFDLPRIVLGFETFFSNGVRRVHERARLHSVILEPDLGRVSLVWQSSLSCHPMVYKLLRTRIIEKRIIQPGNSSATAAARVA